MFLACSTLVDDGIYTCFRIYNPLSSCRTGTQVVQVALEMYVPSDYCLKAQQRKILEYKVLGKQGLKQLPGWTTHTNVLLEQFVAHRETLLDLQEPAHIEPCRIRDLNFTFLSLHTKISIKENLCTKRILQTG